ncbi:MAG: type II toxin-antitoxin system HigB family toxin [Kiritimatiellae bacterium]|nr:type II toxin-antitoxin system HigB family toxin [Kiritimatiellia bacterium]
MHVISRKRLCEFWERERDAEQALKAWFHEAEKAWWRNSAELKKQYGSASIVNAERVVFNICGNKYRLVVRINYAGRTVFIRFVGTHRQYDRIDVETI